MQANDIKVKIVIIGAGGVGGLLGFLLSDDPNIDVTLIARGEHLRTLQERGLTLIDPSGRASTRRIHAIGEGTHVPGVDYIFLCVKLPETRAALNIARTIIGAKTQVISLQNGITKDQQLVEEFTVNNVIGATAYLNAYKLRPGVVTQRGRLRSIHIGCYQPKANVSAANRLAIILKSVHIDCDISDNIVDDIWKKFLLLVGFAAVTSLTGSDIGSIRQDNNIRLLLSNLITEAYVMSKKAGLTLQPDIVAVTLQKIDDMPADMSSSMQWDLAHGKTSELPWINGAVVRLGCEYKILTPMNGLVNSILTLRSSNPQCVASDQL